MKKICTKCGLDMPLEAFDKANNKSGYEAACKECRSKRKYDLRRLKRQKAGLVTKFSTTEAKKLLKEGKKYCPKCKEIKSLDEFSTTKVRKGIASHCRECNKNMSKDYYLTEKGKQVAKIRYEENKKRLKNNSLIRNFGITLEEYNILLICQDGKCAICGKTEEQNNKMLAVDHCHLTGKNRALLCSSCNILLGFIEKNNIDIKLIINYLNKYSIGLPSYT